jgi:hypothetical protein
MKPSLSAAVPLVLLVLTGSACDSGAPSRGGPTGPGSEDGGGGGADGSRSCIADPPAEPPAQEMLRPFTFQVIGDVHGHAGASANPNIVSALADLRAIDPSASALIVNGDLTEHGYLDEYAGLTRALAGGSAPRLLNMGNHDYHGTNSSATELQRYLDYAGLPAVYYEHAINGVPFFFLAGEHGDQASWGPGSQLAWYAVLSDAQLDWLDRRLAEVATPSRPSFVFLHQGTWDTTNPARLEQILSAHPNVIFFWSHYHRDLHSTAVDGSLFTGARGFTQVHTGSVQYTWDNASPNRRHDDWYQGLEIAVFADRIQIRGRDFAARAWIDQFEFQLDQRPPSRIGEVGLNQDGRLELFAAAPDGKGLRSAQEAPGGAWSGFADHGEIAASAPAVARNRDGRLEVFVVGADRAVWRSAQETPGGDWLPWTSLGGAVTSNIAVAANQDGTLELFARGTDHALWHSWQLAPGGDSWAGWSSLGGIITSDVAAARNADGRLEVFTRAIDNSLVHIWQTAPMGAWSAWSGLGGILVSELAAGHDADGRLEVFGLGTDGALFHIRQLPDGGWSEWTSLGGAFASNPALAASLDGRLELFARGHDGAIYHSWQSAPSSAEWSGWHTTGGELDSDVIIGQNTDGRLELYARGTDGQLQANRQQSPGSCWSGWASLDLPVATF